MTMSVVSTSATDRCTVIGTPLASVNGPAVSPTISIWNGGRFPSLDMRIRVKAFITSKMPNSVDATASGKATRLT